jgi:L-rhamnose-H+ transport protein
MPINIFAGIGCHTAGAASAASFYAPIQRIKKWSWETTWLVVGLFSWILLPLATSLVLLPDLHAFYASLSPDVLLKVALFGAMWGIGNVNYGLTMRYLGMSLGIGVAMGVTLAAGTLVPPMIHGQFGAMLHTKAGLWTVAGVVVALIGVAIVTLAGQLKEKQLGKGSGEFNLKLGLALAVFCGIFSAGMSFAIDAAQPIKAAALAVGVKPLYAGLPCYLVIMGGGAIINFGYCLFRLFTRPELSLKADLSQPLSILAKNGGMSAVAGTMWYLQFFFYAWGSACIPQNMAYVNWMLLMSLYVLCGGLIGLAVGEWKGVAAKPVRLLWLGIAIIVLAANLVGLGMAS